MTARIIVADDDPVVAAAVKDILAGHGCEVVVVHDGFELCERAPKIMPHLIITDIQMPGAYGNTAAQVLRNEPRTAKIPVLFMSGHRYEKVKKLLPEDSLTRFLQKPVTPAALKAAIDELLPMGGFTP